MDKRTLPRDVDRVSFGSVDSDHIRIVYFKEKEASLNTHRFLHFVHYNDNSSDEKEYDDPEGEMFISSTWTKFRRL